VSCHATATTAAYLRSRAAPLAALLPCRATPLATASRSSL
jgi:hypothetical protein